MDFVCLANSYKTGGRCVAGIDLATGHWIRPVSNINSGELMPEASIVRVAENVRQIQPLDVISLGTPERCPTFGQPENVLRIPKEWQLLRKFDIEELDPFIQTHGELLLGNSDRISIRDAEEINHSLTLIRVQNPVFGRNEWGRLRGHFEFNNHRFSLSVTDSSPWAEQARHQPLIGDTGTWLLTISLAVPWSPSPDVEQSMFKLVASAIKV